MFKIIKARLKQGKLTIPFPAKDPVLPDRFRGRPALDLSKCPPDCQICAEVCPVEAISIVKSLQTEETNQKPQEKSKGKKGKKDKKDKKGKAQKEQESPKAEGKPGCKLHIDLGRCLFCKMCEDACPNQCIHYTNEFKLATRTRSDLVVGTEALKLAEALESKIRSMFHRSFKLRVVSAGDCNACSVDVNVLGTLVFDLSRFGIQYVAAPRHADGVLITGPVSENMKEALVKTYNAVPEPKVVIAVGSCAISGGPFRGNPEVHNGAQGIIPVDLFIPGCPPHPMTILDGMLRLIGRMKRG